MRLRGLRSTSRSRDSPSCHSPNRCIQGPDHLLQLPDLGPTDYLALQTHTMTNPLDFILRSQDRPDHPQLLQLRVTSRLGSQALVSHSLSLTFILTLAYDLPALTTSPSLSGIGTQDSKVGDETSPRSIPLSPTFIRWST